MFDCDIDVEVKLKEAVINPQSSETELHSFFAPVCCRVSPFPASCQLSDQSGVANPETHQNKQGELQRGTEWFTIMDLVSTDDYMISVTRVHQPASK